MDDQLVAWRRPWLCVTSGCGWQGLNPDDLRAGRCRWCQPVRYVVERSQEGSGIAPGDRVAFSAQGLQVWRPGQ